MSQPGDDDVAMKALTEYLSSPEGLADSSQSIDTSIQSYGSHRQNSGGLAEFMGLSLSQAQSAAQNPIESYDPIVNHPSQVATSNVTGSPSQAGRKRSFGDGTEIIDLEASATPSPTKKQARQVNRPRKPQNLVKKRAASGNSNIRKPTTPQPQALTSQLQCQQQSPVNLVGRTQISPQYQQAAVNQARLIKQQRAFLEELHPVRFGGAPVEPHTFPGPGPVHQTNLQNAFTAMINQAPQTHTPQRPRLGVSTQTMVPASNSSAIFEQILDRNPTDLEVLHMQTRLAQYQLKRSHARLHLLRPSNVQGDVARPGPQYAHVESTSAANDANTRLRISMQNATGVTGPTTMANRWAPPPTKASPQPLMTPQSREVYNKQLASNITNPRLQATRSVSAPVKPQTVPPSPHFHQESQSSPAPVRSQIVQPQGTPIVPPQLQGAQTPVNGHRVYSTSPIEQVQTVQTEGTEVQATPFEASHDGAVNTQDSQLGPFNEMWMPQTGGNDGADDIDWDALIDINDL